MGPDKKDADRGGARGRHITKISRGRVNRSATARRGIAVKAVPVTELTPTVGPRTQDRVLLVSGMVLGATALVALRVLGRGVRTVLIALRPGR